MHNERNVAALAELLHDIIPNSNAFGVKPKGPVEECDFCKVAARALAASGVLAPSALTEEQQRVFAHPDCVIGQPAVVPHLERFARGED